MVPLIRQRAIGDCGIVALSVALALPYDVIVEAVASVDPKWRGQKGLHNHEVIAAAAAFGVTLTPLTSYDLDSAVGVLRVRWNRSKDRSGGHFVALRRQTIFCPGTAREFAPQAYIEKFDARLCTLLALS